ncbi:MAG: type II toxin-antitoxin system VapC family toxin [Verrucomicrobia bacterium]|nr:type II toxin-antitoxin system VapC family toxin [Verrucomicrobiota bacterium]
MPGSSAGVSLVGFSFGGRSASGLCGCVVFAFVRLSTNRRVFGQPLKVSDAFSYLNNWLSFEGVRLMENEGGDLAVTQEFLEAAGTGGNLVTDAQIAAVAQRVRGTVYSADADFGRFKGLRWKNPLKR